MDKIKQYAAVDCDGVLADFEGEFCERFGSENRHLVDLYWRYPKIAPELIEEFIESPKTYEDLEPIFGGLYLVSSLHKSGYGIILMTSRPPAAYKVTEGWLKRYYISHNELIFTKDKGTAIDIWNKSHQDGKIVMMVDDIVANFSLVPSGVDWYVWDQPWNTNGILTQNIPHLRYNSEYMSLEIFDTVSKLWKSWRIR